MSVRVVNPPLHQVTLFLSPSHNWLTPVIREGDGGGDRADWRAWREEMTSSMEEQVG